MVNEHVIQPCFLNWSMPLSPPYGDNSEHCCLPTLIALKKEGISFVCYGCCQFGQRSFREQSEIWTLCVQVRTLELWFLLIYITAVLSGSLGCLTPHAERNTKNICLKPVSSLWNFTQWFIHYSHSLRSSRLALFMQLNPAALWTAFNGDSI